MTDRNSIITVIGTIILITLVVFQVLEIGLIIGFALGDLLALWGVGHLWLNHSEIAVKPGCITVNKGWFKGQTKTYSKEQISSISNKDNGVGVFKIILHTPAGKGYAIVTSITGLSATKRLQELIEQRLFDN